MDDSIASAVVLPEPQEDDSHPAASPPVSQKRRQFEVSDHDEKRRRLSNDGISEARRGSYVGNRTSESASDARRSSATTDSTARTRTRRLFGAALGALSQTSATPAQRRRAEIEKKQQAKLKQQAQEDSQRKQERLEVLKIQRRQEQRKFDEESMRIRHANLLHMAHSLVTKSEPGLYYKPWELTRDEEQQIEEQITEARAVINQEVAEFEARQEGEGYGKRHRDTTRDKDISHDADAPRSVTPAGKEIHLDRPQEYITTDATTNRSATPIPGNQDPIGDPVEDHSERRAGEAVNGEPVISDEQRLTIGTTQLVAAEEASKDAMDDNGEEILEAAEDTVIY